MIDGVHIVRYGKRNEGVFQFSGVFGPYRFNNPPETPTITRRKAPHDAQVDVDHLAALNQDISRMRVGMEEAMLHNLRGVIVHNLYADFFQVVAIFKQTLCIANGNAINVFHDQDFFGAIVHIGLRAGNIHHVFVEQRKLFQVARLFQEVGFLQKGNPQLFHYIAQIEHLIILHETRCLLGDRAHHIDVLSHGGAHAGTLYFNSHLVAVRQNRTMNLSHRGAAQRLWVYFLEYRVELIAINTPKHRYRFIERHRVAVHLQVGKRIAIRLRQNFRTKRKHLAYLDEAWPQIDKDVAQLRRRKTVHNVMLAHKQHNFAYTTGADLMA